MREDEFWTRLRFLINGTDRPWACEATLGYCDWFEVRRYRLGGDRPLLEGRVGFLREPAPVAWRFQLLLPPGTGEVTGIDWSSLLPQSANQLEIDFDSIGQRLLMAGLPQSSRDP